MIAVNDPAAADVPLNGQKITGLADGVAASDAATVGQLPSGGVASVTAGDTSIVVGGTSSDPTIETATLDVIAADHPPAAAVAMNSKKITGLADGSAAQDAAAFGQIPTALMEVTDGTTTVTAVTEIDFTSGATVSDGGGGIAQIAIAPKFHTGSSPPGSPSDGDYWILPADDTNGVYWMFQYDSSEATYKWRFVGGPPVFTTSTPDAVINTLTQVGSTGYYYAPTMSYTTVRAGDYMVQGSVRVFRNGAPASGGFLSAFSGSTRLPPTAVEGVWVTTVTDWASMFVTNRLTAVGSSAVIGVCVFAGPVDTYKIADCSLQVWPVRVS